jgi:hypothetical protein
MLFRIKPGHSFRDHDDTIKGAGELIELDEDAAQVHAQKIEPAEAVQTPAVHDDGDGPDAA